eukprot:3250665-Pyramimonas_sp.AAC.3
MEAALSASCCLYVLLRGEVRESARDDVFEVLVDAAFACTRSHHTLAAKDGFPLWRGLFHMQQAFHKQRGYIPVDVLQLQSCEVKHRVRGVSRLQESVVASHRDGTRSITWSGQRLPMEPSSPSRRWPTGE